MRTDTIVARVLTDCKAFMHQTRWQRLVDLCASALHGQALALTQLALGSSAKTTLRHRVKAVDRLLGNPAFAAEHLDIYRTLAARWLTGVSPLLIVVDWSSLSADMKWHWLRASVVVEGRSITLNSRADDVLGLHNNFLVESSNRKVQSRHRGSSLKERDLNLT